MFRAQARRAHVRALKDFRGRYQHGESASDLWSFIFFHQLIESRYIRQPAVSFLAELDDRAYEAGFAPGVKRFATEERSSTKSPALHLASLDRQINFVAALVSRDDVKLRSDRLL